MYMVRLELKHATSCAQTQCMRVCALESSSYVELQQIAQIVAAYLNIVEAATLIQTPLGPSTSGQIIEVSSFQGLLT